MLRRGADDWFEALRASAQSSDYRSHLDRLGPGSVNHEYADSLIGLLIYCEHTLSAVGETSNESVKLSVWRRLRLVVGIDIHRQYETWTDCQG
jgi:hypothetical protein